MAVDYGYANFMDSKLSVENKSRPDLFQCKLHR